MNIFIDTSILFTDPFFTEILKKEILTACKHERLNIFISEVVIKELLYNYEKNLDKIIINIKNVNINSGKIIQNFEEYKLPEKQVLVDNLNKFYADLGKLKCFHILPFSNEYLPVILEKAINRHKPFSEKKTELNDALIWMTYSEYIKSNKLEDCYLLTYNVNDFGLKQEDDTFIIHPDLKKECEQIILINSLKEIHKTYLNYIENREEQTKQKLQDWIDNEKIDNNYVYKILWENYTNKIADNVSNYVDRIDLDKYFEESHLIKMGGYAEINDLIWGDCSDIEIEVLDENAIISGVLDVNAEIKGYAYNSVREAGDEKYPNIGSAIADFKVHFNFLLNENGVQGFEITDIQDI